MASLENITVLASITILLCTIINIMAANAPVGSTSWCIARSDASSTALETALDYACRNGADCIPIQFNGLCYLPNTIQAHASYAFNSIFQRKGIACDFSGTATITTTDPSFGSCVYPSSLSTAGGTPSQSSTPTATTTNNPNPTTPTTTTPLFNDGPPLLPTTDNSKASSDQIFVKNIMQVSYGLLLSLIFPYI